METFTPSKLQKKILDKYKEDELKVLREFHRTHPLRKEVDYINNMIFASNYASLKDKFREDIHIGRPVKRVEYNREKNKKNK